MNKVEYLDQVRRMMAEFDDELRNEILSDYEEHFEQGFLAGKSEEEIIQSLGDPSELIAELRQESTPNKKQEIIPVVDDEISRVMIEGLSAHVIVNPSNDNEISYQLTDRNAKINVHNYTVIENVKNDCMNIKVVQKERKLFNFDFSDLTLNIVLPQTLHKANITSISGNIEINSCAISEIEVKSTSGDIKVNDIERNIIITTVSGDITGKNLKGISEFNTTSGDIDVCDFNSGMMHVKSISGDIHVENGFSKLLQCKSTSGDIFVEGVFTNMSAESKSGDVTIKSYETEIIKLDSLSGDIDLTLPDCTGMNCVIKTVSGDIDIDLSEAYHFHKNILQYGDSHCAISLKTLSGDISIGN